MPLDPNIALSVRPASFSFTDIVAQNDHSRMQQESAAALQEQRLAMAEQRRAQAAKAQRDGEQEAAWNAALQGAYNEDGTLDEAKLFAGVPRELMPQAQKLVMESRTLVQQYTDAQAKQKADLLKGMAERVRQLGDNPTVFGTALKAVVSAGALSEDEALTVLQQAGTGPDGIRGVIDSILMPGGPKLEEVAPGASLVDPRNPQAGPVFTAPKEATKPAAVQEYEYAVANGFKGSFDDYQTADANRRRPVVNVNSGPRPLTQTAEANMIGKLAGQWTAATKNATELQRQISIMRAGLGRYDADPNGASQAVLVTFQKMLDPESVVRESEYARSAAGISALQRVQGWRDRLLKGGAGVPKAQLAEMVKTAELLIAHSKNGAAGVRRRLGATAKRYNIPEELIFNDVAETPTPSPAKTNPFKKK